MKLILLVNDEMDLKESQTTTRFGWKLSQLGHEVLVVGVRGVAVWQEKVRFRGWSCKSVPTPKAWLEASQSKNLTWQDFDGVYIRTNPSRDQESLSLHLWVLGVLSFVTQPVLNRPDALLCQLAKSNLMLCHGEGKTLMTGHGQDLKEFYPKIGKAILKPAFGTRGQGVTLINTPAELPECIREPMILQEFLENVKDGDMRLVCLFGKPFQVEGHYLAVTRNAPKGSFLTNLHQGGEASIKQPLESQLSIATRVAGDLYARGIALAGLDFIGDEIIEANIFATGGIVPFERLTGIDVTTPLVKSLLSAFC